MATTRVLGLLLVSLSGCATPPPPLPPPTPPTTEAKTEAKTLELVPGSGPSPTPVAATPPPAAQPDSEPDAEYSFEDFKGASGDCYHAVHCLPPPSSGPKVAAAAPYAACEATWHKVQLHAGFSGEQLKKKKRVLCCYRTTVCEQPF
ncbi:MAG: hypothetical protein IPJ34_04910 [Myxococcales bacterium]|nr:hypothetical protein [Myxococcales bacterium]